MSENLSIQEAGKSRNFSGVGVIETETPEGDSCFWVPESECELETEYVIKNGVYRPQKYGFSDVHVNVFDLTIDLDGLNWKIDIGDIDVPDIKMPDISLPDFNIDLSLDIDSIGDMPSIDLTIDGVKLDLPDLSKTIDLDAGFDVSLDVDSGGDINLDLVGMDLNGDDININIDLDDLDIDIEDCPEEIRVMHVPSKTEYTDGQAIDYDGLVVQAFDKDGNPWSSKKYPDGYIPVHELSLPKYAEYTADEMWYHATSDLTEDGIDYTTSTTITIVDKAGREFPWTSSVPGEAYIIINKGYINRRYAYAISSINGRSSFTHNGKTVYYSEISGFIHFAPIVFPEAEPFNEYAAWTALYGESELIPLDSSVPVVWNSPCYIQLETKFQINVTPTEDHGGSHHSGKF